MRPGRKEKFDRDLGILVIRNHGVVPVPFLGTTWRQRGAAYWWRRVGAVALFLLLLGITGFMASGFTYGIYGSGGTGRTVAAVVYALTVLPGIWLGTRQANRAPVGFDRKARGSAAPSGIVSLIIGPFCVGLVLAFLVRMFGRDFLGERVARETTAKELPAYEADDDSRRKWEVQRAKEQAVREARRSARKHHPRPRRRPRG